MNKSISKESDKNFEALVRLIQVIRKDSVISKRVITILQLNPYKRRSVLNRWLEQLQERNASAHLLSALPYLFDDAIAEGVLRLIKKD